MPAVEEHKSFTRILYSILVILVLLVIGAFVFRNLERLSWLDSFYFAAVTLTTIGYGDITPTQDATKLFIIFYAPIAVATVLFLMTNVARYYIERRERAFEEQFAKLAGFKVHKLHKKIRIPPPPTMKR